MSDENIANREYSVNTGRTGSTMPGSWVAGNGEMGAGLGEDPILDAGSAGNGGDVDGGHVNVTATGTGNMIDVDDQDQDIGGQPGYGTSSDVDSDVDNADLDT